MTRVFYFVGGLIALTMVFVAQSVLRSTPPEAGPADRSDAALAVAPAASDAAVVAIDDLAAWPAAAGR